eukprot:EG_transcript_6484
MDQVRTEASTVSTQLASAAVAHDDLVRLLAALRIYAFPQEGGLALYASAASVARSCDANAVATSRRVPGRLCHVALRPIPAGEPITVAHDGPEASVRPTVARQARLARDRGAPCRCSHCSGPDRTRGAPCPRCHPRQEGRLNLSKPDIHYAYTTGDGAEWSCTHCHATSTAEEVFPGFFNNGPRGAELEALFERMVGRAEAEDPQEYTPDRYLMHVRLLGDMGSVLGMAHHITVRLALSLFDRVVKAFIGVTPSLMAPADSVGAAMEYYGCLWEYSIAAGMFPACVHLPDVAHGLVAVLERLPPGHLPPAVLPMVLASAAVEHAVQQRTLLLPCLLRAFNTTKPAFELLKDAGNASFKAARYDEALLLYRCAALVEPRTPAIHSNISTTLQHLSRHPEAVAAAEHCVFLKPAWPKGHYRLASALEAQGARERARDVAVYAAALAPGTAEFAALLARLQ